MWLGHLEQARQVADRQGVCVHFTAPATVIADRITTRGDPVILDIDQIEQILTRYEQVFAVLTGHVPVIRIDTTND